MRGITILFLSAGLACTRGDDKRPSPGLASNAGSATGSGAARREATPPLDVKTPPADATRTASGLIYKKLVSNEAGAQIRRNDTVLVQYNGWRQRSGETFHAGGQAEPMPLNLAQAAKGFVEAMQLLRKGEKAMLWVPPELGYKTPPTEGAPETLVYEIAVADVSPAPATPDNVARPPDKAAALPSGTRFVVMRPGTAPTKIRQFDTVTFHFTAWDAEGRMVESTEFRNQPVTVPPFKQPPAQAEMLTAMTPGERTRFWADAEYLARGGKPVGGVTRGLVCYELEILQVTPPRQDPPPTPPDIAKPPAGAQRTAKGVYYRRLKEGAQDGKQPTPSAVVKVNYAGWHTDGRMFDSSYIGGEPAQFGLNGVIEGWKEGIPLMRVGERTRFWIPEELAYKGQAGKPAGMLVFDVELIEILPAGVH